MLVIFVVVIFFVVDVVLVVNFVVVLVVVLTIFTNEFFCLTKINSVFLNILKNAFKLEEVSWLHGLKLKTLRKDYERF